MGVCVKGFHVTLKNLDEVNKKLEKIITISPIELCKDKSGNLLLFVRYIERSKN